MTATFLPDDHPTGIEARVCQDIAARQRLGVAKYGRTLAEQPIDLSGFLVHAYEGCLDQAIYLKAAIERLENDRRNKPHP
jgi:hypothetical protein